MVVVVIVVVVVVIIGSFVVGFGSPSLFVVGGGGSAQNIFVGSPADRSRKTWNRIKTYYMGN